MLYYKHNCNKVKETMNHLDRTEARLALAQFLMECESSDTGKWIVNPVDAKVDKIFVLDGPQKNSWVIRRTENFLHMYFAEYIYVWLSKIPVAYIGINWVSKSIDIYYGITDNGEITSFGIRFPFELELSSQIIELLEGSTMAQFSCAPQQFDKPFEGESTGIAVQVRHILEEA